MPEKTKQQQQTHRTLNEVVNVSLNTSILAAITTVKRRTINAG